MQWRKWVFDTLSTNAAVTDIVPADRQYAAGRVMDPPAEKPFLVIRMEELTPGIISSEEGPTLQQASIWVHDEPGSYVRIGQVLAAIRQAFASASRAVAGLIGPEWQGESGDLSDETMGTITRNASYRLVAAN